MLLKGEASNTFSLAATSRLSGQRRPVTAPDHLLLSITLPPVKLSKCQKPAALTSPRAHTHNGYSRWKRYDREGNLYASLGTFSRSNTQNTHFKLLHCSEIHFPFSTVSLTQKKHVHACTHKHAHRSKPLPLSFHGDLQIKLEG